MNKKKILSVLFAFAMTLGLTACGGSGSAKENKNTGEDIPAESADSSTAEEPAEEEVSEESSSGSAIQDYEFTKTVFNQDLEKPITACGLQYDESRDRQFDEALDQERDSLHLHISILEIGYDMNTQLEKCKSDNTDYVTSIARGYNVQQADATSSDGSAKFTVIRYTNFEDDGENDYKYMGDLVYTDGTSTAYTEFMYSIDKEYGNGEEVEAAMKAITGYYGIDYGKLDWVDQENSAG